jgi:hypothetical protein
MSNKDSGLCLEHSGCEARIQNLEENQRILHARSDIMSKDIQDLKSQISKRINQIFMAVIVVLLGLVANFSLLFFKGT